MKKFNLKRTIKLSALVIIAIFILAYVVNCSIYYNNRIEVFEVEGVIDTFEMAKDLTELGYDPNEFIGICSDEYIKDWYEFVYSNPMVSPYEMLNWYGKITLDEFKAMYGR